MIGRLQWQGKKVLVTGGAGFIGSHLVAQLADAGARVTVLDDFSTGCLENLNGANEKTNLLELDIRHAPWQEMLAKQSYEAIFHLAANAYVPPSVECPAWDYETNLDGTFRLLEAVRKMGWRGSLIYASSAAVYGDPARIPICEDDPTVPISPYGVGKLAAERYLAVYSRLYGLKAASMRFFSVYGPRQRKQVIFDLIRKIANDSKELFVHGDGTQVRDFNYVEDTVGAMMLVAESGALQGETYNVASGRGCSIRELATELCHILEAQPEFIYSGSVRPGDPEKWLVNIDRLSAIGYRPHFTLEDGLRKTIEWFNEDRKLGQS